jgi:hypothetical protein
MSLEPFFEKYCTNTSNGKIIEYLQFSDDDDPNYDIIEFKALFPDEDSDQDNDDEDDDNNENQDNPNENNDEDDESNTRKSDKDEDDDEDEDEQPKKRGKPNRS